jgi:hypothetical protein
VLRLRAAIPPATEAKLNPLALLWLVHADDLGDMEKMFARAIVRDDEAETALGVKELDGAASNRRAHS